ncbi:HdeD family acid-resistance protein [Halohasta salina]|uniref:HdeD family acid-resistance protein n=1 Tax=Halohasta salina TaxID=2961621 RepID=UPI0020A60E57|nr:DUF308 domain-containing protein [Halohasta salina]
MATESPTQPTTMTTPGSWRPVIIGGLAIAIVGLVAIVAPFLTGVSLSLLLGGLLVVGGVVHLVGAFGVRGWSAFIWQVLLAGVYGIAGVALLTNPIVGLATLTTLVIAFFVFEGIAEIGMGLRSRAHTGWTSLIASGLLSLVLAGLLVAGLPGSLLWAVGLLFGVNVFMTGATMAYVGYANRRRMAATAEEPVDEGVKPSV